MDFFKTRRVFFPAILIFLFLSFGSSGASADIILDSLDGSPVNLSGVAGRPAIIFFWTTWCHFCRQEIAALSQKYERIKKEGITVFLVNIGEPKNRVTKFLKDRALNFNALLDEDGMAADSYGVIGVPTFILVDKKGSVVSSENRLSEDYKILLLK